MSAMQALLSTLQAFVKCPQSHGAKGAKTTKDQAGNSVVFATFVISVSSRLWVPAGRPGSVMLRN